MDTPKTVLKERDYSTNTRQQVAKMSGVGAGTEQFCSLLQR